MKDRSTKRKTMTNRPIRTIDLRDLLSALLPKLLPVLLLMIYCNTAVAQAPTDAPAKNEKRTELGSTPVDGPAIKKRPTNRQVTRTEAAPAAPATRKDQDTAPDQEQQ